jgi:AraC-like DNA-binding protein
MENAITIHRISKDLKTDNQYVAFHSHDFYQFVYGLSGKGKIIVSDKEYIAQKHTVILIPPNTDHAVYGEDNWHSISTKFSCNSSLGSVTKLLPVFIGNASQYESILFKHIFEEAINQLDYSGEIATLKLQELIFCLSRRIFQHETTHSNFFIHPQADLDVNIRLALDFIDQHIEENLSITELAKLSGYSNHYFSSIFKTATGYAPKKYINHQKIAKSKELLLYSGMNITEISDSLGFESIHYFSRLFKQIEGITPLAYQNKSKEDQAINMTLDKTIPITEYATPIINKNPASPS